MRFDARREGDRPGARADDASASATRPTRSRTSIPVEVLASPETVAAYGDSGRAVRERGKRSTIPAGVVPGFGGLHVELSSTAHGRPRRGRALSRRISRTAAPSSRRRARWRCCWRPISATRSRCPGWTRRRCGRRRSSTLEGARAVPVRERRLRLLAGRVLDASPYLTAYVLHVFKIAADLKYDVDTRRCASAPTTTSSSELAAAAARRTRAGGRPTRRGRRSPSRCSSKAAATQDSHITRLYGYRDRMPVFALAYLHDALVAKGEATGARVAELRAPDDERHPARRRAARTSRS